jgi:hypothetical protein
MTLNPEQERLFREQLEKMGETQVRSDLDHGRISNACVFVACEWLSERERESKRRREAIESDQIAIAREASAAAQRASDAAERAASAAERQAIAAERANTRATIALTIAILAMIVTAIGIWVTHWDAHR